MTYAKQLTAASIWAGPYLTTVSDSAPQRIVIEPLRAVPINDRSYIIWNKRARKTLRAGA